MRLLEKSEVNNLINKSTAAIIKIVLPFSLTNIYF